MKNLSFFIFLGLMALTTRCFSQLTVDSNGNTIIKSGVFSTGNDAILYLGDNNHYIKSIFGYGVRLGTPGLLVNMPQYSGCIGINREPSYTLDVNGNIRANSTLYTSDERFKTDIKILEKSFEKIKTLNSYSYILKNDSTRNESTSSVKNRSNGFMAQEFITVFPELTYTDKDGYMAIDYISLIPVLIEAIKEQQLQIEELKKQIKE